MTQETSQTQDLPQIYLVSPSAIEIDQFPAQLAAVLDAHDVACVRLALASKDESILGKAADACREICHARDVAIVLDDHLALCERHGLDGVHLSDGSRGVRAARKELGDDAVVGAYCGTSRHDGMNAGEAGADYVAFGPIGETALGDGTQAEKEMFEWWSSMIEVPVVAEGALGVAEIQNLTQHTDFFAIGDEIWSTDDPVKALGDLIAAMQ